MSDKTTRVISFRVPEQVAKDIDRVAEKEEKPRADLVKEIFVPAFERIAKEIEREVECV